MTVESMQQLTTTNSLAVTQASTSDANSRVDFAGANISSISGCQFQIFDSPIKIIQGTQKRRKAVIESDDEEHVSAKQRYFFDDYSVVHFA